jgi:hypothetical protein
MSFRVFNRTASRLSETEAHVRELSKCQKSMELSRYSPISSVLSLLVGLKSVVMMGLVLLDLGLLL